MSLIKVEFQFDLTDRQISLIKDIGNNSHLCNDELDSIIASTYNADEIISLLRVEDFSDPAIRISFVKFYGEYYNLDDPWENRKDNLGKSFILDEKGFRICDIQLTEIGRALYFQLQFGN